MHSTRGNHNTSFVIDMEKPEAATEQSSPSRCVSIFGLLLQIPMVVFIGLEVGLLIYLWRTYLVKGMIFDLKLDEQQQEQLGLSMRNYFFSILVFVCVWYKGISNFTGGICGLIMWGIAFLTFGDDSTEETCDALYHLVKTRLSGETDTPFEFSKSNKLYRALLAKVVIQCVYTVVLFLFYEWTRLSDVEQESVTATSDSQSTCSSPSPKEPSRARLIASRCSVLFRRLISSVVQGFSAASGSTKKTMR